MLLTASNLNMANRVNPGAELLALARTIAAQHALDPALVCAVIEQESAWDAHAIRYEPAFRVRYVAPLGLPPSEEIARSISWGLMQVMGQVAREHGFTGKFLSALGDPAAGLDVGCVVLASKFAAAARLSGFVLTNPGIKMPAPTGLAPLALSLSAGAASSRAGEAAEQGSAASEILHPDPAASSELSFRASPTGLGRGDEESAVSLSGAGISAASSPASPVPSESADSSTSSASAASSLTHRALLLWNGGANPDYPAQVLARLANYR
ncbi:MAG TPA: transglycosylase SLT domain-containing protein [Candidatus Acidoferrales bacterium]|nr:transglycosylase SLT domain-containing protein [Candidatus Acidoferrales bacterium]